MPSLILKIDIPLVDRTADLSHNNDDILWHESSLVHFVGLCIWCYVGPVCAKLGNLFCLFSLNVQRSARSSLHFSPKKSQFSKWYYSRVVKKLVGPLCIRILGVLYLKNSWRKFWYGVFYEESLFGPFPDPSGKKSVRLVHAQLWCHRPFS